MPVLEYKLLSLGAKNSTVAAFETLVDDSLGLLEDSSDNTHVGSNLPVVHTKELDQELYDKAAGLPEAKTVSFKYLDDTSKHQYGNFKGGNVYKSYDGDIDSSKKNVKEQKGWIILDKSSKDYCLFTNSNNDTTYIIAIKDFEPTPIIEDFTPLYDKLKQRQYAKDESCSDDTHLTTSLATTFKDDVSKLVKEVSPRFEFPDLNINLRDSDWYSTANDVLFNLWKIYMAAYMSVGEFSLLIKKLSDPDNLLSKSYDLFPEQIGFDKDAYKPTENTSSYNDVQAIIYDLPPDMKSLDRDNAMNMLMCFQQPESISYTSQASYEAVTPRGTQIPFQLYQNANQMDLSFVLKWHIDEVRSMIGVKSSGLGFGLKADSSSLQEIAEVAENFSRPWDNGSGSLTPKMCKVILPGISEIGYISSVAINYTGSMSGTLVDGKGSGVYGASYSGTNNGYEDKKDGYHNITSDYFYSELEITFNLIIIKDVKLLQYNKSNGYKLDFGKVIDRSSNGLDAFDIAQGIMNGAADTMAAMGGLADAMKQMSEATANIVSILT